MLFWSFFTLVNLLKGLSLGIINSIDVTSFFIEDIQRRLSPNSVIINQNEQKTPNKSYIYNVDSDWCVKRKL